MRGYYGIELSSSACVRFVRNGDMDGSEQEVFEDVRKRGIRYAYVDLSSPRVQGEILANQIGGVLTLEHAPYTHNHWVCFLDDLITLAHREQGLVIVVDSAWLLLEGRRGELFDLIEAFLVQFHHWLEQRKPCYLCLQMDPNRKLTSLFAPSG
jgi:hypothetical protein